jgi:hypothetical protein
MPSIGQENLETVMIDFFGALRGGNIDAAGLPRVVVESGRDPDLSVGNRASANRH